MFNPQDAINSPMFQKCQAMAETYLLDRQKAGDLINSAGDKLTKMENSRGPVGEAVRQGRSALRMVAAYVKGDYKKAPIKSLVSIAGALLYFVSADDLIDDDTPFVGYLDDAAVMMFAIKLIQSDLDEFLAWESTQAASQPG